MSHETGLIFLAAIALLASGCIIDPHHVEDDFGNSVRRMVNAQIYDPEAASNPDQEAPLVIDGVVVNTGVEEYRNDAERPNKNQNSIIFTVN